MEWEKFEISFRRSAAKQGLTLDLVNVAIDYAFNLHSRNLPIIFDLNHLSLLTGYTQDYILRATNSQSEDFYRSFKINKKSGGQRIIHEPLPSLKQIQRWLLDNLFTKIPISKYCKGFVPHHSIKDNAKFHLRQEMVLSLDIKDFFPSIKSIFIFNLLKSLGYSLPLCKALERLCSLKNSLPQGAPTSPFISNIFMLEADSRISKFAKKFKIRYTRYADDLTISGQFNPSYTINTITEIVKDYGLEINCKKTRLMRKHQRQEVTGITVNKFMQASRKYRLNLRKDIYYIKKFGLAGHLTRNNNTKANYLQHLKGVANHILDINPNDKEALSALNFIKLLY